MGITIEELKKLDKNTYQIIDIRDENEVAHGAIPGAVATPADSIEGNENIDFSNNRLHFIQQKTGDLWEMELFPEVKDALQDYILTARPPLPDCPNVFLTSTIPYKPLDSFAINTAIWMLVAKSDVDITDKRHGSRAFRSSIASNMVNDRVSTEVVRKVLGHGTKHAIRHYARLDIENMRLCPLATPEPTGIFAEMLLWKGGEHHV